MNHQKPCSVCRAFKPLNQFTRAGKVRHHRCLQCERERSKLRIKDGSLGRANAQWKKRNPHAAKAHRILRNAIKRGDIQRGPCSECGKPGAHGHHEDYSKPLVVTWLCHLCHIEHHRRERFSGRGQSLFSFIIESRP